MSTFSKFDLAQWIRQGDQPASTVGRQSKVNMSALRAETGELLYNALLFSGSTSDEANIKFTLFSSRRHKITRLHVSDSGKGRWRCGARRSYSDICKSFIVTDTMHTTPGDKQLWGTVDSISNSYQRLSGFTPMSEFWLSHVFVDLLSCPR